MRRRAVKPYWIETKWDGECSRCKAKIKKHERALYDANSRTMLCNGEDCGRQHERDMAAADFDEAVYSGGW